jgi:hypothetical protein
MEINHNGDLKEGPLSGKGALWDNGVRYEGTS